MIASCMDSSSDALQQHIACICPSGNTLFLKRSCLVNHGLMQAVRVPLTRLILLSLQLVPCAAGRLPLYFQHQGHSRTIIGIQRTLAAGGTNDYSLLLLDPGAATSNLQTALSQQRGWQVKPSITGILPFAGMVEQGCMPCTRSATCRMVINSSSVNADHAPPSKWPAGLRLPCSQAPSTSVSSSLPVPSMQTCNHSA